MQEVSEWMKEGSFLHPLGDANSADLARGVAMAAGERGGRGKNGQSSTLAQCAHVMLVLYNSYTGVSYESASQRWGEERMAHAARLGAEIGDAAHLAYLVLDGLGMNVLSRHLPPTSFLRTHLRRQIRSVFPATTAAGVTSLTTGDFPSQHGLLGWTVPCRGRLVNPLPFTAEEPRGVSLEQLGYSPLEVFEGVESMFSMIPRSAKKAFSRYAGTPYTSATQAMEQHRCSSSIAGVLDELGRFWRGQAETAPGEASFAYAYIPEPDQTEHEVGFEHERVAAVLQVLDRALQRLWDETAHVPGRKLVITADHGHCTLGPTGQLLMGAEPEDAALLACLVHPGGTVEPRSPCFHCRPGKAKEFANAFRSSRFAAAGFVLLMSDDVESAGLLGPGPLSPAARARLGDFMAVTRAGGVIKHGQASGMVGWHGGGTPAEVLVPLVVAVGGRG